MNKIIGLQTEFKSYNVGFKGVEKIIGIESWFDIYKNGKMSEAINEKYVVSLTYER